MTASLIRARHVADAVLYEGYLLYPYRSTSQKNQARWQFGVLGPPSGVSGGIGEPADLVVECLLHSDDRAQISVHLRFLQLQERGVEQADGSETGFVPVDVLEIDGTTWLRGDEAIEHEVVLGPFPLSSLLIPKNVAVHIDGGEDERLPS